MTGDLLAPGLVLGIPLVVSLVYLSLQLWRRHRFIELAAAMKAELDDQQFKFDTPFGTGTIELDEGSSDSRRKLEVRLGRGKERLRTLLRRETSIDRFGKVLAVNDEAQIGDHDFDHLVYIESDVPHDALRGLLAARSTRRAIYAVFAEGYDEVSIHGTSLVAARVWDRAACVPEQRSLRTAVDALLHIAAAASTHRWPLMRPFRLPAWYVYQTAALGLALCFQKRVARCAQATFQPIDPAIYRLAMLLAFCTFAIGAGYLFDKLRGRSESLRLLVGSLVLLGATLPGWSVAAVVTCNGAFDRSPSHVRWVRAGGHGTTTGASAHPYVDLVGLRDDVLELELAEELPARLKRGDDIAVEMGSGALGWEWIRGVSPVPEDPPEPRAAPTPSARTTALPRRRPVVSPVRPSGSARKSSGPAQGLP